MKQYRQGIWEMLNNLLAGLGPIGTALDFGSGDGWIARKMLDSGCVQNLQAIDVKHRTDWVYPAQIYGGGPLPFADRSFDLTYTVDVLHHCPDPAAQLADVLRCTRRYFVIKDHTYRSKIGFLKLCLCDEIGNRWFGIPSLYRYQKGWEWDRVLEASGFVRRSLIYPAACQDGLIGRFAHGLHFLALWERGDASSHQSM